MIATVTINPAFDKICYVDDFQVNRVHRITEEAGASTIIGGKGVNISVMLKMLGAPSIAMGFAGGILGTKLELELRKLGITTNFVRTEQDTRTDIFVIDRKNDMLTVINVSGKSLSDEDIFLFMDRFKKILNQVDIVVMAGSLLPGFDVDFYGKLVRLAKQNGVKSVVHARPTYLDAAIKENAYMVFPDMRSTTRFQGRLLDSVEDCIDAAKIIIERSGETAIVLFSHLIDYIVAVAAGKAYVFSQEERHFANLLGFGDAILSGVVYGLEQGQPLKEALSLGSRAGYITMERQEKFCTDLKKIAEGMSTLRTEELEI